MSQKVGYFNLSPRTRSVLPSDFVTWMCEKSPVSIKPEARSKQSKLHKTVGWLPYIIKHFVDVFTCMFSSEKFWHFDIPKCEKCIIGSGRGFAPNRQQAIIWTCDDPVHRRCFFSQGNRDVKLQYYCSYCLNKLLNIQSICRRFKTP